MDRFMCRRCGWIVYRDKAGTSEGIPPHIRPSSRYKNVEPKDYLHQCPNCCMYTVWTNIDLNMLGIKSLDLIRTFNGDKNVAHQLGMHCPYHVSLSLLRDEYARERKRV